MKKVGQIEGGKVFLRTNLVFLISTMYISLNLSAYQISVFKNIFSFMTGINEPNSENILHIEFCILNQRQEMQG